jgi:uncharacterized protein (DUF58 family)
LLGLWFAAAIPASIWPVAVDAWWGTALAGLVLALLDAAAVLRAAAPTIERRVSHSIALGQAAEVALRAHNAGSRRLELQVFDEHPADMTVEGLPARLTVPARGWAEIRYTARPLERGVRQFGEIDVLIRSPLRIWLRRCRAGTPASVRVYPNFAAVAKYTLLATDHRLSQLGIRHKRRRGEGLEFHQLREYRRGDVLRQIDWKATSRYRKLVSREYQDERDQQVFFLIDCGRRMAAREEGLSHFDMCLNAVLLLAYVALRQGDAVGVMSFSGTERFLPPQKGMDVLRALLEFLFDLQPSLQVPDYLAAASAAAQRLRKRSLIVLVTNLRDEDGEEIGTAQRLLRQRHLVLLANLRETALRALAEREVVDFDDAIAVAAAHRYLSAREQAHNALHAQGAYSLDVEPQALSVQLVNSYLDVKRSGRL